ncbi:PREDICTED: uncharacterized protein LOC108763265 [Trachymyrmex cornetzi]|uniref:uncharacterized protein LOC108763265 n=1 Tax=Trachymyrmex cornetzi TaxID=471704 RepID=UPI00084F66E6|nr:PREDICTED: uncharacterized protein LOC108763265 [Trachymyrmex cornetzi]
MTIPPGLMQTLPSGGHRFQGLVSTDSWESCWIVASAVVSISSIWSTRVGGSLTLWQCCPVSLGALTPRLLLTIYRAAFRSAVEYGSQFFVWRPTNAEFVRLQRLQYRIIRRAMGYRISTPINVMLAEAKEHNFSNRLKYITSKFIYKTMASKFSPVYSSLEEMEVVAVRKNRKAEAIKASRLFRHYVLTRHEEKIVYRSTYPPAFWHTYEVSSTGIAFIQRMRGCDKNNTNLIKADFYHKSFSYRQGAVSFYTDGSKSLDEAVGAAVYSPEMEGTIEHRLPLETSVFTAELWAIYQAVLAAGDLQLTKCVIFSDSESALEALSNFNSILQRNYLIYFIKQAYIDVTKRGTEITLFWVPAHCGIPGNEIADQCAKRAALGACRPHFQVPHVDLQILSRMAAVRRQEDYIKRISVCAGKRTRYYELYHTPSMRTWFHEETLSRNEIVLINRLRANHVNTQESLHRIGIVNSSACPCGDSRQTVNHLIFHFIS